MTLAAPFLWWISGTCAALAVFGWGRHKGLGVTLLIVAGLLAFWAATGTSITIPKPVVTPSHSATVTPAVTPSHSATP